MTAKEKANDLINKMDVIHYVKLIGENSNSKGLPVSMYNDQIKQCATICVDEIIKELESFGHDSDELQNMDNIFRYWDKVKKEIELL